MSTESSCAADGFTILRQGDFAVARPSRRVEDCLDCRGTGLIETAINDNNRVYTAVTPCPQAKLTTRAERFTRARIPGVHSAATFETYRPSNAEQARALQVVKDFALKWPQPRGFILSGPVGTGKTHLLASALRFLTLERNVKAAYVEISLLYSQIRRGFQEGKSGGEIIGPLSQIDVLAIDELGKGRGSTFELETLDELIARRYNGGHVTLFATNYSLRPPEERAQRGYVSTEAIAENAKESKLLCDRVGDRIYSRLCEMCEFVEFPPTTADARRSRAAAMVGSPSQRRRTEP